MINSANWIKSDHSIGNISPVFKKKFFLSGSVKRAVASVSAFGVYNFYINEKKVGKAIMAPGWTSFGTRIQYQTYDVTDLLTKETALSLKCAKGSFRRLVLLFPCSLLHRRSM